MQKLFLSAFMCASIALTACSDDDSEIHYDGSSGFVIDGDGYDRHKFDCSQASVDLTRLRWVNNTPCPSDDASTDKCPYAVLEISQFREPYVNIRIYSGGTDTRLHPWKENLDSAVYSTVHLSTGDRTYSSVEEMGVTSFVATGDRLICSIRGTLQSGRAPFASVEVAGRFEIPQ